MIRRIFLTCAFALLSLSIANTATASHLVYFDLAGLAGSGLLPGNETGGASGTGSGDVLTEIVFDMDTNMLAIDVGWGSGNGFTNLTGDATAMHIHGPADQSSTAGVFLGLNALPGFTASASNGGFTGTVEISNAIDIQTLMDGNFYLNVHTTANPGGELRGNLVAQPAGIPEPTSLGILGLVAGVVFLRRRRG